MRPLGVVTFEIPVFNGIHGNSIDFGTLRPTGTMEMGSAENSVEFCAKVDSGPEGPSRARVYPCSASSDRGIDEDRQ